MAVHWLALQKPYPPCSARKKIQKRAARTGFDWPDVKGAEAKIYEELEEIASANTKAEQADEIGDLLFAAVNLARFYDVDAEEALKSATAKFDRRFRAMEDMAGPNFPALSLDEKENLWNAAKKQESDGA